MEMRHPTSNTEDRKSVAFVFKQIDLVCHVFFSLCPPPFFLQYRPTHTLHVLFRSYKVRFNSVSSYSDTRKSSSDEPEAKANFESTGPLANVRWVRRFQVVTYHKHLRVIGKPCELKKKNKQPRRLSCCFIHPLIHFHYPLVSGFRAIEVCWIHFQRL